MTKWHNDDRVRGRQVASAKGQRPKAKEAEFRHGQGSVSKGKLVSNKHTAITGKNHLEHAGETLNA